MSEDVVSPVFIGRRREMALFEDELGRVLAGEAGFVLVGGEAGVGKTRLVRELSGRARDAGFLVLSGQCVEPGAEGLPLAPLVDVLRALAHSGLKPDQLAQVLGPARSALSRLMPELSSTAEPPGPSAGDLQKAQFLELVLGVLDRLGAVEPVLLVIEDLHWADQSTLDLAAFLIRSLRAARVLLVMTYRSDELHRRHPLRPLFTAWERDRSVRHAELRRFGHEEVAGQLRAILGGVPAPDLVAVIADRSGGNAYLVEELTGVVRAGGDPADLPPSLKDVLLSRVDALSAAAQRLLRTASVAGRTVADQLLAEVADVGKAELFAALRETVDNHLLVVAPEGHGYQFRHALTRDAVYEDMLPGERVELHAAYAGVLVREPGLAADEAALPTMLAYHWYAALDLPRALPAVIDAASRAAASYAPAEALRHLERALEIWPRVPDAQQRTGLDRIEVCRRAADAAYRSGELDRVRSLLASTAAELPPGKDPERQAMLLWQLALVQIELGALGPAAGTLREALALLPADETTRTHAVILTALTRAYGRANKLVDTRDAARRAVAAARAAQAPDVEAEAAVMLGATHFILRPAEHDVGLDMIRAGLRLALDQDIPSAALRGYTNLSEGLNNLGRYAEAERTAAEGFELAVRAGMARMYGCAVAINQADSLLFLGRWEQAEQVTARALAGRPEGRLAADLRQLRAELAAMRGRYDEADRELRTALGHISDMADYQFAQPVRYTTALIALGRGDLAAARDAIDAGMWLPGSDHVQGARYTLPLVWLGMRAEADEATRLLARRGEVPEQITARCAELARFAAELPAPPGFPALLAYQSLVAAEHARADAADDADLWAATVAAWRTADRPYQLSYALTRLAEADATSGDRDRAASALREAHAIAERLGAAPIAVAAAALARRARVGLDTAAGPDPEDGLARFGLSDREREVLRLVAAGHTNREIAMTLFISPKTASVHVSNILAKLGVDGRVEAAAVAHRFALPEQRSDTDRRELATPARG
jgi:DNA-binding CsgD family transcriptional regulator/tetratricopeptide (TPR) repeat protein